MVTEFIFVRHGETQANRAGILQGNTDCPLNENGIRQAHAVAEYLQNTEFDAAYSSPLSRAFKTAEIIAGCGHENMPLLADERLREWNCGQIDGLKWEDIHANYSHEAKSFCFEQIDVQMPGGESGVEFQNRIAAFLDEAAIRHVGKRILLVAHGGVLQRMFRVVAGVIVPGNMIPLAGNASVSSFIYNHDLKAWQLTSWNIREHLKGIPQHISRVL
ncbi:MAG: histidine phosphatase family protein [Lentisphaerae bacterium]|nr:histidine phosphatase family protein [Lentisphaerota bacterium]